jgi:hypothetical protein
MQIWRKHEQDLSRFYRNICRHTGLRRRRKEQSRDARIASGTECISLDENTEDFASDVRLRT